MKLTAKGRYAVTAMLDIATHSHSNPVKLHEIAYRQAISLPYLEQLFAKLRRNKLVKSVRGPGGGYLIIPNLADISVDQIVMAVDEDIDTTKCQGLGNCKHGQQCITHTLWCDLNEHIRTFLSSMTLAQLIKNQDEHVDQANLKVMSQERITTVECSKTRL